MPQRCEGQSGICEDLKCIYAMAVTIQCMHVFLLECVYAGCGRGFRAISLYCGVVYRTMPLDRGETALLDSRSAKVVPLILQRL